MNSLYSFHMPHDDVAHAFLKFLNDILVKAKFEKKFERLDPGSMDMYRYINKKGYTIVITRVPIEEDKEELKITSEHFDISKILDKAADAFGKHIAKAIKSGRRKK